MDYWDFMAFGAEDHLYPCYLLASANVDILNNTDDVLHHDDVLYTFKALPHFDGDGLEVDDERIKRFKNFMMKSHLEDSSLQSYLNEGGNLLDCYTYVQYGAGYECSITIPERIVDIGSTKLIREMISIEPEYVNTIVEKYPLLYHSINHGHREITDLLLLHGADPNVPGKRGKTPLYAAIVTWDIQIVKKLLDNGADPSMTYAMHGLNYLHTALYEYTHYSSDNIDIKTDQKNIVKMIIKHGVECQYESYNEKIKKVYDEIIEEMNESGEY